MRNDVSEPPDRAYAGRILPERNLRSHLVIIDGTPTAALALVSQTRQVADGALVD